MQMQRTSSVPILCMLCMQICNVRSKHNVKSLTEMQDANVDTQSMNGSLDFDFTKREYHTANKASNTTNSILLSIHDTAHTVVTRHSERDRGLGPVQGSVHYQWVLQYCAEIVPTALRQGLIVFVPVLAAVPALPPGLQESIYTYRQMSMFWQWNTQGSHFSGLTKFPDFSLTFPVFFCHFPVFFNGLFF